MVLLGGYSRDTTEGKYHAVGSKSLKLSSLKAFRQLSIWGFVEYLGQRLLSQSDMFKGHARIAA